MGHHAEAEQFSCAKDFTNCTNTGQRNGKSKSHTDTIEQRREYRISGRIGFRSAQNDTVYDNQRNKYSERI